MQGVGQALWEHAYYDPITGQLLAGSFQDYVMPRAGFLPSFTTELSETLAPGNPLGVRAGGEGGTTPTLAVVVNAVVDALADYGVTHIEMPSHSRARLASYPRWWGTVTVTRAGSSSMGLTEMSDRISVV